MSATQGFNAKTCLVQKLWEFDLQFITTETSFFSILSLILLSEDFTDILCPLYSFY